MKIKKITIRNFRSYYDTSFFDINEGLTLIIGDNGDGKTTFFEALQWLFKTSSEKKDDIKLISEKRISEMKPGDSDVVSVSMDFEHNGDNTLECSFSFTMNSQRQIVTSAVDYALYTQLGTERIKRQGKFFEYIFDSVIRRYCLFKGESEINIFNDTDSIKNLVEIFGELKNFDPYVSFADFANKKIVQYKNREVEKNTKNTKKAKAIQSDLEEVRKEIFDLEQKLKLYRKEEYNFASLIKNLENNKEAAEQIKDVNDRLEALKEKQNFTKARIREEYSIDLLDEMWILCGFETIAQEYGDKINALRQNKKKQEVRFLKEKGAQQAIKHIQHSLPNNAAPLPIHVPDVNTMKEMLKDEVCKVCGRVAPKGSEAYIFMESRLNEYIKSLKLDEDEDEEKLFCCDFIEELDKRNTLLQNNMPFIAQLSKRIIDAIEFNAARKKELAVIESNIEKAEESKKNILAQSDGMTAEQLEAAYTNISNWWQKRSDAQSKIKTITEELEQKRNKETELQKEFDKLAANSGIDTLLKISEAFDDIFKAFTNAKEQNKRNFIEQLEKLANKYIHKLNGDDFTGIIRLVERIDGRAIIELIDSNGKIIHNPNTALKTTECMSILFAVAELTSLKKDNDYPLIFDAPTSSFSGAKESHFFNEISKLNKQTIIVTKSFLKENEDGRNIVDMEKVQSLEGSVYLISKVRPFDIHDLSTIQTVAYKLK